MITREQRHQLLIEDSQNRIFYAKPTEVHISTNAASRYATTKKLEDLITDLREYGPLVGRGKIGPANYVQPPQLQYDLHNHTIYHWKPGSVHTSRFVSANIIILGVNLSEKNPHIIFTVCSDVTHNKSAINRTYIPNRLDKKIYSVSHTTFRYYMKYLFLAHDSPQEADTLTSEMQSEISSSLIRRDSVTSETNEQNLGRRMSVESNGSTGAWTLDSFLISDERQASVSAGSFWSSDPFSSRRNSLTQDPE